MQQIKTNQFLIFYVIPQLKTDQKKTEKEKVPHNSTQYKY